MAPGALGLFGGAVVLGAIHGAEPGHGWPVAAAYAMDRPRTWFHAVAASTLLGLGHLVSSIAVVAVFFLAKHAFDLTRVGWIRYVAGLLLVALGVREYRHDHGEGDHGHDHGEGDHSHDHGEGDHGHDRGEGWRARLPSWLPLAGGGHGHDHAHLSAGEVDTAGLWSIVGTAFVLGFAHEEEFEIIGLCLGSNRCLAVMLAYAVAVLVALVAMTLALVAGFKRYEQRVARYADYLPTVSAAVLILLGLGFIAGVV